MAAALDLLGIAELAARVPHDLSGGEKRKVALAGALVMEPELLVLDEPFEGLDPAARVGLVALIEKLARERGVTVVMSTHDIDSVHELADYAYVLKPGGEIALHGTPAEVFANADALERSNIKPPILAELFAALKQRDPSAPAPALSIEDAVDELTGWKEPLGLLGDALGDDALGERRAPCLRGGDVVGGRLVLHREVGLGKLEADRLELGRHLLRRAARPPEAAEHAPELVGWLEPRDVLDVGRSPVVHLVMQRRAAEKKRPGVDQVRRHASQGRLGEVVEPNVDSGARDAVGDLAGDDVGRPPHGAVGDDDLVDSVSPLVSRS